jgi:hypothetical protein
MKPNKSYHKDQHLDRANEPEKPATNRHDGHQQRRKPNPRQKCTHGKLQKKAPEGA